MRIFTFLFYYLATWLSLNHSVLGNSLGKGKLKDTEFVIEKERSISLQEASPLVGSAPASPRVTTSGKSLTFDPPAISPPLAALSPKIKLLRAKQDAVIQLYENYFRVGYGNFYTPYLEGFLTESLPEAYTYGLHVKHLSHGKQSWGETTHNLVRLHGKRFEDWFWLGGGASYRRDRYPLHPYDSSSPADEQGQYTDHFVIQGDWGNYDKTVFNFQFSPALHHFALRGNSEQQFLLRGRGIYMWGDDVLLQGTMDIHCTQYNGTRLHLHRFKFLRPFKSYSLGNHDLDMQLGLHAAWQVGSNQQTINNPVNVTPVVKIRYPLYTWLRAYASFEGDIHPNSLENFVQKSPWLAPQKLLRHTSQPVLFDGHVEGELKSGISFSKGFSVGYYEDFPLWVNSWQKQHYLTVMYERGVALTRLYGNISYANQASTWVTRLKGVRCFYALSNQRQAWHRPNYEVSLLSTYKWYDKVMVKGQLSWVGGLQERNVVVFAKKLSSLVNLDIDVDYAFNSRVSILGQAKWALLAPHDHYLHHLQPSPHLMIGISYIW